MSLFWATFLSGSILTAVGVAYALKGESLKTWSQSWPRSQSAALVLFGSAALWFLWHIAHLGKADFGDYKTYLLIGFGLVAVGSFFKVRDFLAPRGLAALMLLSARPLLDAAYMEFQHPQRLLLVVAVYVGILLALWVGASPYKMRDFYEWLYAKQGRARLVGLPVAIYGFVLLVVSFTY